MKNIPFETLLQPFGTLITSTCAKKNASQLFKDHSHIPIIIDTINRKYTHHALIKTNLSARCLFHFCEVLHAALNQQHHTHPSSPIWILQLEISLLLSEQIEREKIVCELYDALSQQDQILIICIHIPDHSQSIYYLQTPFIRKLSSHPLCRMLAFTEHDGVMPRSLQQDYLELSLPTLTEVDALNILKLERVALEAYHHVIIPDLLLSQTYTLAKQYISTYQAVEKAILLLDSTAARAHQEAGHDTQASHPVLTLQFIANVLSSWIQIPAAQLISHHFNAKDLMTHLQQKIYEQDIAIQLITKHLQQHKMQLNAPKNELTHFLFAGPKHCGKNTAIKMLAHYFYKQTNMIYYVDDLSTGTSLLDLSIRKNSSLSSLTLKSLIQQMPYAIIVFEHIEQATPSVREELYRLLSNHQLEDQQHLVYSFHQACFIFTTTLGAEHLHGAANQPDDSPEQSAGNLLQLIMSEKKAQESTNTTESLSKLIMNEICQKLPMKLCQKFFIVPFLPAGKAAIEKIIRLKLKEIGDHLREHHAVILGYAPEVIRYLTQRAAQQQITAYDDSSVALEVDHCIEHALRSPRNQTHSNQLFLQLNDTGQVLRCDWLAVTKQQTV